MDANINFDNLIPLKEASSRIPFAVKTLRNWRTQRKYAKIFIKIGGKVFVDISEFEAIIRREKEAELEKVRRLCLDD
jgi:hypothetical protein